MNTRKRKIMRFGNMIYYWLIKLRKTVYLFLKYVEKSVEKIIV